MTAAKVRPNAPHRLIVEGRDDQMSIIELTARHGWDWEHPAPHFPYIEDARGDRSALEALPVSLSACRRVGLVLDADLAPLDRWQSIRDRVSRSGLALPERPDPAGTLVEVPDGRRLGIWLMPDNRSPGKLEDFLALLVPPADPCWDWSEACTATARRLGARFAEADFIKARIHTWLAWQEEPALPFGTAIRAATFAHDAQVARGFVAWMERLFVSL